MKTKSFQLSIKTCSKNEPLHVARGPFLVQRTTFLVQRAMFLRPLDERRPQSAKKVSALDAFGAPAASPSGPKVRRKRPGSFERIPKSGKGHPNFDAKNAAGKRYQMYTKTLPKSCQNGYQNHRFVILFGKRLKCSKLFVFR